MAKVGDKFIIEIEEVYTHKEDNGAPLNTPNNLYRMKGFNSLVFDKNGLDKLEKYEKIPSVPVSALEVERNAGYEEGLNDAWETARKLNGMGYKESCEIFGSKYQGDEFWKHYSAAEAIAKIKAYEEQKKAEEEIKVGDEIEYELFGDTVKAVVIQVVEIDDGGYKVLCENGCGQVLYKTEQPITKTGKHFDIDGILKAMRSETV